MVTALVASGCAPRIAYAPTPQPITLRYAFREQTLEMDLAVQAFQERYPWITIEIVEAQRFGNQLGSMIEAASIDIIRDGRDALEYAQRGLLRPLDEVQLGDWSDVRDDYYPGAWEGLRVQGQQWGIPAGVDMLVMYVNMDQAAPLKAPVPESDWGLIEFLQLTNALNFPEGLPQAPDVRLFGFCTDPQNIDSVAFVYLMGGRIVDDINAPSVALLDSPRTVEAVQWYADLFNTFGVAPQPDVVRAAFPRGGVYEAAIRGACGVWLGWYSGRGGGLDERFKWAMRWKMLPLPHDGPAFSLGDEQGYFVTRRCPHPKEALLFLRFLSDRIDASGLNLPPRRSLAESEAYAAAVGEEIAAIAATFSSGVMMLPADSAGLETLGGAFIGAVNQIVKENLAAYSVLGEAQDQVKNVFQQP
jgi:ABC-type glycerol-3-phosphate transport system substrate-binding protein